MGISTIESQTTKRQIGLHFFAISPLSFISSLFHISLAFFVFRFSTGMFYLRIYGSWTNVMQKRFCLICIRLRNAMYVFCGWHLWTQNVWLHIEIEIESSDRKVDGGNNETGGICYCTCARWFDLICSEGGASLGGGSIACPKNGFNGGVTGAELLPNWRNSSIC